MSEWDDDDRSRQRIAASAADFAHAIDAVAYGENADDAVALDRPGARAATEHDVLRPLAGAGLTKPRVRALARALGGFVLEGDVADQAVRLADLALGAHLLASGDTIAEPARNRQSKFFLRSTLLNI